MASDVTGIEAKQLQRRITQLQARYELALQTLLLIRDTRIGTQEPNWYSELASRTLAQIKSMETTTCKTMALP